MHKTFNDPDWRKRAAARLMPWFEGAVVVVNLLWLLCLLVMVVAAVGFYVVAVVICVPVCALIMRLGGWRIGWKELFARRAR